MNPNLADVNTDDAENCEACTAHDGDWPCAYHAGVDDGWGMAIMDIHVILDEVESAAMGCDTVCHILDKVRITLDFAE